MNLKHVILIFVLISIIFVSGCINQEIEKDTSQSPPDKSIIIALYSDQGADEGCIQATRSMFEWMGYTVTLVKADYINNEGLGNFSILCIPGGDMYQYSQDISSEGKENIRNFIREGGSYIGICGGAYFTGEKVICRGINSP